MGNETTQINDASNELGFMGQYFADAGIKEDDTQTAEQTNEQSKTTGGEQDQQTKEQQTNQEQTPVDKDSGSSNNNKDNKSGEEKKGTSADSSQNLAPGAIKLKDGTVINAGAERRWYDSMNVARQKEQAVRNELNTERQKLTSITEKYNALSEAVTKIGFDKPEEMRAAVDIYKDLMRSPVETVTKLVAELKAKGYKFDDLGGAVDTQAITEIIDRRLKPFEEQHNNSNKQAQTQAEVDREFNKFISDYPDAVTHDDFLAAVVEAEAQKGNLISFQDAYFTLKQSAIDNGFDWSKPLGPQIEARKTQTQQTNTQRQAPRASGVNVMNNNSKSKLDPAGNIEPENDSTEAIIRAAMKEHGFG